MFRVSEQGGSKTWDITTGYDGTAILENLEIGTTYIVEETTAPAGYVNSGYKEAIILNECAFTPQKIFLVLVFSRR